MEVQGFESNGNLKQLHVQQLILTGEQPLSCRVLSGRFVCQFQASGNTLAITVGYCLLFLFFLSVLLAGRKDGRRKGKDRICTAILQTQPEVSGMEEKPKNEI